MTKKLSKSESIVKQFVATKNSLSELEKKMNDEIISKSGFDIFGNAFERAQIEKKYKDDIFQKEKQLKVYLRKLYSSSLEDNFYYFDSPFAVYEHHYDERLLEFKRKYIDASEADFIKQELEDINNPRYLRVLTENNKSFCYEKFLEFEQNHKFSRSKKINFLTEKLKKEGWKMKFTEDIFIEHYDRRLPRGEIFFEKIKVLKEKINSSAKIKWIGKPSQLGFIMSNLAQLGYIEAPRRKNGEINHLQFARLVMQTIECETTESTLSKYLNLDSEKGQETLRKFESKNFRIPHKKEIS